MIKIDKNIPLPKLERKVPSPRQSKYPFADMEVNDSFEVAGKTAKQFAGTVYSASKKLGKKFTMRSTEAGVRVWRTV
jgi:hypothetical protein